MGIFFEVRVFRFASDYRDYEGYLWFQKVLYAVSMLELVAAHGNYFFDNRRVSV
jgi:hypothetical protein